MVGSESQKRSKTEGKPWRWVIIGAVIALIVALTTKYSGMVVDCCCDYETVDRLNEEVLHPSLQDLVKTPFFRYFKVKLGCDCPFWPDDGMCHLRDCSVCECPETEMTYVNLQLKPDQYTGYSGPSARRIWDAIYSENCPKYPSEELCREERILYKLISGLHFSISIHIADRYLLDKSNNLWGCNPTLMYDRVLRYTDRVRNLYFTYLFVLRAVMKDLKAHSLMRQLLYNSNLQAACLLPFDEAKLWKGQHGPKLKQKIQEQSRNISCSLQRNEAIALMNLLNRLSESVKLVHEMGPAVEMIMEGQISPPTAPSSLWQRMRSLLFKS
ncbi:hypothetical protein P3X46_026627 [Hevea brasiliensis]|uniref:Uncharacterized protein n=1 Tax=Hevea brasiliensis TaxID=3981 RepID=A0ABQ9KX80_HEVBR|nr:hypothetical protein P3X46_026627 [Hevea brasiliensis]